ncbi:hypothetical protein GA0061098_102321 [Bradyrhizobium shewense]|uniref:Uncharacterized protein n=1 Tax=Bradyrhizobium shewense TaxID=1761772 RepID=A0A1C3XPT4_9BRAD|nr:hypothetical protein [Bradyrhizobium shewense]SCB54066.1 hypothetical protein GA0061098_102321 [Bradyrhizobium shewense]
MSVYRPLPADHEQAEHMRQLMREARELLNQPPPDTFLGRKTTGAPPKQQESDADTG